MNVVPDDQAYSLAASTTQVEYARVDGIEHVKGALAREHPVVFAISLPMRCYQEAAGSGVFPVPSDQELAAEFSEYGTHAMLLVGYDTDANFFHVRNSWGTRWGDQGYARLSIDTFQRAFAVQTAWILGSLEAMGTFSVARPAAASSSPTSSPVEGSCPRQGGGVS